MSERLPHSLTVLRLFRLLGVTVAEDVDGQPIITGPGEHSRTAERVRELSLIYWRQLQVELQHESRRDRCRIAGGPFNGELRSGLLRIPGRLLVLPVRRRVWAVYRCFDFERINFVGYATSKAKGRRLVTTARASDDRGTE